MSTESKTANAKHIFIDIVSYTHNRSVEAQSDLITVLNEIVLKVIELKNIPDEKIIFIPTGDGMCISLLDLFHPFDIHLSIALEILELLNVHNQKETDEMRQFNIRIGINENLDNIITDINGNTNVSGSGINHASRIEGLADANQIIVGNAVHEILVQREKYMNSFKSYETEVKHGLTLSIHQLVDSENKTLNSAIPSRFVSVKKKVKLNQLQAYYLGLCIKHEKFISDQMTYLSANDNYLVIQFIYMAIDCIAKRNKTKSNPTPKTKISGTMEEVYKKLYDSEYWVTSDLSSTFRKEHLREIADCFDELFLYTSEKGKEKLKSEHPEIFDELELN